MSNNKQDKSEITAGKILSRVFLFLILAGLIAATWFFMNWLYQPGNFPFNKVELTKQLENQQSSELQKAVAETINGGFFSLNVDAFRADLLASLPWIKAVAVRKVWPDKLLLSISEHKPVMRWSSVNNDFYKARGNELLSNEGIIFYPHLTDWQQEKFKKMALLSGPESNAVNVLTTCHQINEGLKKLDVAIKQCGMNERRTWMVKLSNDMDIKLGKENMMQKLKRFVRVFSGQLKPYLDSVNYADLRYSNGFSIKWNTENTEQLNTLVNKRREQE